MGRQFGIAVAALLVAVTGCNLPPMDVQVYVDNSSDQPLFISVDGLDEGLIEPGDFAELSYPPGEHRFVIRTEDETICDLSRTLEPSDQFGRVRKYLFDPCKGYRYQQYEVKYGGSRLDGLMETSLLSFQKDEKVKNAYLYEQLLKEIELVPDNAWNDVSGIEYVLSEPPEIVFSKSGSVRKKVLDRIDHEDCDRLTAAANKENPSESDLDSLGELVDEVLAKAL